MEIFNQKNLKYAFSFLENLQEVEQGKNNHPAGNAFNHSIQVLNIALKETDDIDLILAAMLHDIGKAVNTLEHDKIAIEMLKDYASVKTLFLIENHLRIRLLLNGDMKRLSKVQFLINHPWLPELILLARK